METLPNRKELIIKELEELPPELLQEVIVLYEPGKGNYIEERHEPRTTNHEP